MEHVLTNTACVKAVTTDIFRVWQEGQTVRGAKLSQTNQETH